MKTLENADQIENAFNAAKGHQGANHTNRLLQGDYAQENLQEWDEYCTVDGCPARIVYLFENSECESDDASDYPFDVEHVQKIELLDE